MQRQYLSFLFRSPARRFFSPADLLFLPLFAATVYGLVSIGQEWRTDFNPITVIDLSGWSLPRYAMLSAFRGVLAYLLSLSFALVIGYIAARSRYGEIILLPVLDILQSIPVFGFLPGITLGLIAVFPNSNVGLELATVIMIFTCQVWNMIFSFYGSLKAIPKDFIDASKMMGLSWSEKLKRVELPFSALDLTWNSIMSMAGGWFFLSICESFSLGNYQYRLPGIGAYTAVAIEQGNVRAILLGILAMIVVILVFDLLLWRPVLAWTQRFRIDDLPENPKVKGSEPILRWMLRESKLIPTFRKNYFKFFRALKKSIKFKRGTVGYTIAKKIRVIPKKAPLLQDPKHGIFLTKVLGIVFLIGFCGIAVLGAIKVGKLLALVSFANWIMILKNTGLTLLRVFGAIILSSLWTIPFGVWVTSTPTRIRLAQPIIQVLASFPAPMLFPLVFAFCYMLKIPLGVTAMFLMFLGVQWYVLFNVIAGALRIPQELKTVMDVIGSRRLDRWTKLYLPCIFPSLVTGWVAAAGGAWNASIVTEHFLFSEKLHVTAGLGSTISGATARGDFPLLVGSLTVMVAVVVFFNRTFWAKLYQLAQNRYRID